jgi:hypothetical protein
MKVDISGANTRFEGIEDNGDPQNGRQEPLGYIPSGVLDGLMGKK